MIITLIPLSKQYPLPKKAPLYICVYIYTYRERDCITCYICMYIYIYIYMYTCVCMYIYIYIHIILYVAEPSVDEGHAGREEPPGEEPSLRRTHQFGYSSKGGAVGGGCSGSG